jgi:hypothetical protein
MSTDIEQVNQALVQFSAVEAGLQALRQQYEGVVYDVTTGDGMAEAKAARLAVREPRYEVERIRKAAKAPLLAIGKKLDADAARITAALEKLEAPIDGMIKAEEARKEAERQAKIAAEAARVTAIQERLAELRGNQMLTPASGSALIAEHIADLERIAIDDSFAEFREQAEDAKAAGLARLDALLTAAIAHEDEQARIKAERAELERLRAEQEARDKAERERLAAAERAARAAREQADREAAERLRHEREALDAQRREQEAAAAAERARLDAERRAQEQAAAAEAKRLADERAEIERQRAALAVPNSTAQCVVKSDPGEVAVVASPGKAVPRPSDDEIITVVAEHFGVSPAVAAGWLSTIREAA